MRPTIRVSKASISRSRIAELLTQSFTGTGQSHAHGRRAHADGTADLRRVQAGEVAEREEFAVAGIEGRERVAEVDPLDDRRVRRRRPFVDDRDLADLAP